MAKIKNDPSIAGLRGRIGNLVHRQVGGRHIVSAVPDLSDRVLTPKQELINSRLGISSAAFRALDPSVRAACVQRAKELSLPANALFYKSYWHGPSVQGIDGSRYTGGAGQTILVQASDAFAVAEVQMAISVLNGGILEEGKAVRTSSDRRQWSYQTTVAAVSPADLIIKATAVNWADKRNERLIMHRI